MVETSWRKAYQPRRGGNGLIVGSGGRISGFQPGWCPFCRAAGARHGALAWSGCRDADTVRAGRTHITKCGNCFRARDAVSLKRRGRRDDAEVDIGGGNSGWKEEYVMKVHRSGDKEYRVDQARDGTLGIVEVGGTRQSLIKPLEGHFRVVCGEKTVYCDDAQAALDVACFLLTSERLLEELQQVEAHHTARRQLSHLYEVLRENG